MVGSADSFLSRNDDDNVIGGEKTRLPLLPHCGQFVSVDLLSIVLQTS